MKTAKVFRQIGRHLVLLFLACLWLVPILWLVVTSFGVDKGPNLSTFFPSAYTLDHYKAILLPGSDSVSQFPRWFMNTFTIAIFTCIISSMFVLMVAYAMSCMRFKARKPLMNIAIIMNLFPGFLSMIAVYFIMKNLNLTIQQWEVPSVNMLGAVDDGAGRWVKAIESDGAHPNSDGHREMSYAIVPSLFDALDAGKTIPQRQESTAYALGKASATQHIEFVPENIVHPFTLSFEVKASSAGTLASFETENGTGNIKIDENGNIVYESPSDGQITSTTSANDEWLCISLTHYYAWGMTQLYVNGVKCGELSEKLVATKFALGGSNAPDKADYRQLFFWRSGMNDKEIAAVAEGKMLRSSLEIYAPLSNESPLLNLAQSTNTLALVENTTSGFDKLITSLIGRMTNLKKRNKINDFL